MPSHLLLVLQVNKASLWDPAPWGGSESLGNILLEPTVVYVKRLLALIESVDVKVNVLLDRLPVISSIST